MICYVQNLLVEVCMSAMSFFEKSSFKSGIAASSFVDIKDFAE